MRGRRSETVRSVEVDGRTFIERRSRCRPVPPGYHDLVVEVGTGRGATRRTAATLIAAPERAMGWEVPRP
jgi:hypothetical protein